MKYYNLDEMENKDMTKGLEVVNVKSFKDIIVDVVLNNINMFFFQLDNKTYHRKLKDGEMFDLLFEQI